MIPCSGVVVFDNSCDEIRTVLVQTHRGNYSYPKGKRHKEETYFETAMRELEEETGIKSDDITILEDFYIDELSNKRNPNVRYFVGYIDGSNHNFSFDDEELESVKWVTSDELLKLEKLKESRKEVFRKALEIYQNKI